MGLRPARRASAAVAGISPERGIPPIARRSFQERLPPGARPSSASRGQIVVWPDTFTNHLQPEVGMAALRVLRAAGFEPVVHSPRSAAASPT